MPRKSLMTVSLILVMSFLLSSFANGSKYDPPKDKNAIVIASFGTPVPSAFSSIITTVNRVKETYPGTEV